MILTEQQTNQLVHAIGGYVENEGYMPDTFEVLMEKIKQYRLDRSKLIDVTQLIDAEMIGYKSALIREYGFTRPHNTLFARYDTLVTLFHAKNKIMEKDWS